MFAGQKVQVFVAEALNSNCHSKPARPPTSKHLRLKVILFSGAGASLSCGALFDEGQHSRTMKENLVMSVSLWVFLWMVVWSVFGGGYLCGTWCCE